MNDQRRRPLGLKAEAREEARKNERARIAADRQRNDDLLKNEAFRGFLSEIANRCGYFNAAMTNTDWMTGYVAALRDLVNGVVCNSSTGAEWLREYAAMTAAKRTQGEHT